MKNLYEVGRVYIWQNQRWPYESLDGIETTVTEDILHCDVTGRSGQQTDTIWQSSGSPMIAEAGDLRPKNPPSGEQTVLDQLRLHEPVTA